MARKLTVVVSQGPSNHPEKRNLEENLVTSLIGEPTVDVSLVPHLYNLSADHSGMMFLRGVTGDLVVLSWLYPRSAFWTLDRQGVKGREGKTLLKSDDDEESVDEPEAPKGIGATDVPGRGIYCLDLRSHADAAVYLAEIRRIASELATPVVSIGGLAPATVSVPSPPRGAISSDIVFLPLPGMDDGPQEPPHNGHAVRLEEVVKRRWYPVIDYSRCTNCMECIDFCLFGVYGVDSLERILVEEQDNCKKGCPACSRVCPENAILFPEHKSPAIAGAAVDASASLKIDLSKLFGGGGEDDPLATAVSERDVELVKDGRHAVGMSVGVPKRQASRAGAAKDDLDHLMDDLDSLGL